MNLHFHSNYAEPLDQRFHSKRTSASIYTRDPCDPDVIRGSGSLNFHWNGRRNVEISESTKLSVRTYVFITLRDPDFFKRAGKRSNASTRVCSCSCFSDHGSRRIAPPLEREAAPCSANGRQSFVIHAPDQGWITWITTFPLEKPSPGEEMSPEPAPSRGLPIPPLRGLMYRSSTVMRDRRRQNVTHAPAVCQGVLA